MYLYIYIYMYIYIYVYIYIYICIEPSISFTSTIHSTEGRSPHCLQWPQGFFVTGW